MSDKPAEGMLESVEDLLLKFNTNEIRTGRELAQLCWETGFRTAQRRAVDLAGGSMEGDQIQDEIRAMQPDESEWDDS